MRHVNVRYDFEGRKGLDITAQTILFESDDDSGISQ